MILGSADAVVVRGGISRTSEMIREQVVAAVDDGYGATLSVFLDDPRAGEGPNDTVFRLCRDTGLRNGKIQIARVQDLLDAGFTIEHDDADDMHETHHNVVLPDDFDLDLCQKFVDCFNEPVPNPAKMR